MPDIEGSLREIEYGFDKLKADGVGVFTNYGDKWLGDPAFATHPMAANCCRNLIPDVCRSVKNCVHGSGRHDDSIAGIAVDSNRADVKPRCRERVEDLGSGCGGLGRLH